MSMVRASYAVARPCLRLAAPAPACCRGTPGRSDCDRDSQTGLASLLVGRPCPGDGPGCEDLAQEEILEVVEGHAVSLRQGQPCLTFEHHCVDAGRAMSRRTHATTLTGVDHAAATRLEQLPSQSATAWDTGPRCHELLLRRSGTWELLR